MVASVFCAAIARIAQTGRSCSSTIIRVICPGQTGRNQRLIADNANGKGMMVRGAVRKGEALLAGLLRCGHCGRRLLVSYNGTKGDVGRYNCDATRSNPGADPCISFGALRVDEAVGAEIVRLCSRSALKRRSTRSRNVSTSLAKTTPARTGA